LNESCNFVEERFYMVWKKRPIRICRQWYDQFVTLRNLKMALVSGWKGGRYDMNEP